MLELVEQYYVLNTCTHILVIETNKIFRISYFVLHITFSAHEIITGDSCFKIGGAFM